MRTTKEIIESGQATKEELYSLGQSHGEKNQFDSFWRGEENYEAGFKAGLKVFMYSFDSSYMAS